jgi:hypothetical protein
MKKLFTDHPASVGENYFEHLFAAARFSGGLLIAALACLVHAVLPFIFVKTSSIRVTALYQHMVTQRDRRNSLPDCDAVEG